MISSIGKTDSQTYFGTVEKVEHVRDEGTLVCVLSRYFAVDSVFDIETT